MFGLMARGAIVFTTLLMMIGCSTVKSLRPLAPGQVAVQSSLVGVFLHEDVFYGAAQPAIGARYGLTDTVELRGHIHPATWVSSVVSGDMGVVWHGPRLGALRFHGALDTWWLTDPGADTRALRGIVNGEGLVHWEANRWLWVFGALNGGIAFDDGDFVPGAGIGAQFMFGRWELAVESKLAAFDESTRDFSQPFIGVAGRGILYGGIGVGYRL